MLSRTAPISSLAALLSALASPVIACGGDAPTKARSDGAGGEAAGAPSRQTGGRDGAAGETTDTGGAAGEATSAGNAGAGGDPAGPRDPSS